MGSSYFGEPNMGNERGGGSSSSSRKGKKSNSEKPKQPQRGLGVAQLEKIRLHEQMGSTFHPSLHGPPNYPSNFNLQEDIRVQSVGYSSMAATSSFSYSSTSSASYGFHPSIMMGLGGEYDQRANISYGDSQPSTAAASWNSGRGILGSQPFVQPNMTRRLLSEDVQPKKSKKHRSNSSGSSSQNSESNEAQELDLELRLSL